MFYYLNIFYRSNSDKVIQLTPHLSPEFNHGHEGPPPPYTNNFVGPPAYSNLAMHNTVASTHPDGTRPQTSLAMNQPNSADDYKPSYNQGRVQGYIDRGGKHHEITVMQNNTF